MIKVIRLNVNNLYIEDYVNSFPILLLTETYDDVVAQYIVLKTQCYICKLKKNIDLF